MKITLPHFTNDWEFGYFHVTPELEFTVDRTNANKLTSLRISWLTHTLWIISHRPTV